MFVSRWKGTLPSTFLSSGVLGVCLGAMWAKRSCGETDYWGVCEISVQKSGLLSQIRTHQETLWLPLAASAHLPVLLLRLVHCTFPSNPVIPSLPPCLLSFPSPHPPRVPTRLFLSPAPFSTSHLSSSPPPPFCDCSCDWIVLRSLRRRRTRALISCQHCAETFITCTGIIESERRLIRLGSRRRFVLPITYILPSDCLMHSVILFLRLCTSDNRTSATFSWAWYLSGTGLKVHSDVWPLLMSSSLHRGPTVPFNWIRLNPRSHRILLVLVVEKQHEY